MFIVWIIFAERGCMSSKSVLNCAVVFAAISWGSSIQARDSKNLIKKGLTVYVLIIVMFQVLSRFMFDLHVFRFFVMFQAM